MTSRSTITATIRQQQAAGSRPMLGSLRSPRAPHIQPLSATIRQQAAGPCSARSARLARPQRWPFSATSSSSIPAVRYCPRPPPSRSRSFLAVCANSCAWIIIHFGFSVLDNYSFLPLSANNFNKVGGKIPASRLSLLAPRHSATLRRRATTKCGRSPDRPLQAIISVLCPLPFFWAGA